jgi:hypothetical protein
MADGTIAAIPIEDDMAPAVRVARLSGQRFRNSVIDNTIVHKLIVAVDCAAQDESYQQCRQEA